MQKPRWVLGRTAHMKTISRWVADHADAKWWGRWQGGSGWANLQWSTHSSICEPMFGQLKGRLRFSLAKPLWLKTKTADFMWTTCTTKHSTIIHLAKWGQRVNAEATRQKIHDSQCQTETHLVHDGTPFVLPLDVKLDDLVSNLQKRRIGPYELFSVKNAWVNQRPAFKAVPAEAPATSVAIPPSSSSASDLDGNVFHIQGWQFKVKIQYNLGFPQWHNVCPRHGDQKHPAVKQTKWLSRLNFAFGGRDNFQLLLFSVQNT